MWNHSRHSIGDKKETTRRWNRLWKRRICSSITRRFPLTGSLLHNVRSPTVSIDFLQINFKLKETFDKDSSGKHLTHGSAMKIIWMTQNSFMMDIKNQDHLQDAMDAQRLISQYNTNSKNPRWSPPPRRYRLDIWWVTFYTTWRTAQHSSEIPEEHNFHVHKTPMTRHQSLRLHLEEHKETHGLILLSLDKSLS